MADARASWPVRTSVAARHQTACPTAVAKLVGVTQPSPPRRRRALGCGIAATAVALVGVLPTAIVFVLGSTVDPNYGWLLFLTLPIAVFLGAIGVVVGIVGIVLARTDGGGYAWPVVGVVLGAIQLIPAAAFLTGG